MYLSVLAQEINTKKMTHIKYEKDFAENFFNECT